MLTFCYLFIYLKVIQTCSVYSSKETEEAILYGSL